MYSKYVALMIKVLHYDNKNDEAIDANKRLYR